MTVLARLAAPLCGAVLAWYALAKIADPMDFLKSIHAYNILPEKPPLFLNLAAALLPWVELLAGASLLTGRMRRGAALASAFLVLTFTVAVAFRIPSEIEAQGVGFLALAFDCGCGTGVVVAWQKLAANLVLLTGLWVAFRNAKG